MLKFFTIASLILSAVEAAQDPHLDYQRDDTPTRTEPLEPHFRKYRFTPDDDQIIIHAANTYGDKIDYVKLASHLTELNRFRISPKDVRERHKLYLFPQVDTPWSSAEDEQLLLLGDKHGRNFDLIAQFFPSRDSTSVKNRFNTLIRPSTGAYHEYIRQDRQSRHSSQKVSELHQLNKTLTTMNENFSKLVEILSEMSTKNQG